MASKQPRRSDFISDLKFMAQTTCMLPCLFGLFWPSFELSLRKKEDEFVSTRVVGFAATKKAEEIKQGGWIRSGIKN